MIGKIARLVVTVIVVVPLFLFILLMGVGFIAGMAGSSSASQLAAADAPISVTSSDLALADVAKKLETTLRSPWCFGNLRGNLRLDKTNEGYKLTGGFAAPELLKKCSSSLPLPLAAVSHRCLDGSRLVLQFVDEQGDTTEIIASDVAARKDFVASGPALVFFGDGVSTDEYPAFVKSLDDFFGAKNGFLIHVSRPNNEIQIEVHGNEEGLAVIDLPERNRLAKDNAWMLSVHHFQSQPVTFSYVDSNFELIQPLNLTSRVEPKVRMAEFVEGRNVTLYGDENFDRETLERLLARLLHSGETKNVIWLTKGPGIVEAWMVTNPAMQKKTETSMAVMKVIASEIYSALPEDTAVRLHACDRYLNSFWSIESSDYRGEVVIKHSNRIYYFEPIEQQTAESVLATLYEANLIDEQRPSEFILFEDNGPVLQFPVDAKLLTDENIEQLLDAAEATLNQVFPGQRSFFGLVDANRELIEDYEWVFNEDNEDHQEVVSASEDGEDHAISSEPVEAQ
ncbi:MAG: hypothetical protein AAF497_14300 [Planctomycetota bacterium]